MEDLKDRTAGPFFASFVETRNGRTWRSALAVAVKLVTANAQPMDIGGHAWSARTEVTTGVWAIGTIKNDVTCRS